MTVEEVIEILKNHHMWTGEPQEIPEVRKENIALAMSIKALETLQHIDTVLNGTLEVHGFPISMVQEDVFRYKAIISIMEDFNKWQESQK